MSNRKADLDDRRRNSYDYSNRRDGERDRDVGRDRDRERERDAYGDRERDRDRRDDRYFHPTRENPPKEPQRTSSYSSPVHKTNPPTGPRSDRGPETAPIRRASIPAAKIPTSGLGSEAAKKLIDFGEQLTERAILKLARNKLEDHAKQRKAEHEKTKQKHGEFPSVPEYYKRAQAKDEREIEVLDQKLKLNEPLLLKSAEEVAKSQAIAVVPSPATSTADVDARIEALWQKKMAEMEQKFQSQLTSQQNDANEKLKRFQLQIESLQVDLTKEKGCRMESKQGIERLHLLTNQQHTAIKELRDELNARSASSAQRESSHQPTPDPEVWKTLKSAVEKHDMDIGLLQSKVTEHTHTLGDLDVDHVNEACDAVTTRLPALDQKCQKLIRDNEQTQSDLRDQFSKTQMYVDGVKNAQKGIIESVGGMIDGLRKDAGATDERVSALENAFQAGEGRLSSSGYQPASVGDNPGTNAPGLDGRVRAPGDVLPKQLVASHDFENLKSKLTVVENKVQSIHKELEADRAIQNTRIEKLEGKPDQDVVSQQELQHTKTTISALSDELSTMKTRMSTVDESLQALGERIGASEEQLRAELQQKMDFVCHQWTVLDSQYNNLTTEEMANRVITHLDQFHPNYALLVQRVDGVLKGLHDLGKRVSIIDLKSTEPSPRVVDRVINLDEQPRKKRKMLPEITNGNH